MDKIITCPYCGAQYLPNEIFYPEDFIGDFFDIEKDEEGHIEHTLGNGMKVDEEYTCDFCNHTFKVTAEPSFTAIKCEEHDFNFDCTTDLYGDRTVLKED